MNGVIFRGILGVYTRLYGSYVQGSYKAPKSVFKPPRLHEVETLVNAYKQVSMMRHRQLGKLPILS